jgi:large subunit ribosomal protein L13
MEEIVLDAKGKALGRIASEAALILNGKSDLDFMPNKVTSKKVRVINIGQVLVSGNKLDQKKYYRHSGFPGAIKSRTMGEVKNTNPAKFFVKVVTGMIPRNRLRSEKLKRLIVEI